MSEQPAIKMKPRTLIHIGAGEGRRLAEWRKLGPERIVLVEAERSAVTRLRQHAASQPNVQVIQAALGKEAGEAELSIWNFARLNSLQAPTPALQDLFPGLIRKERQIVPVITPAHLKSEIGVIARPLCLIVETPGNEMALLAACRADGVLDQIDEIELLVAEDVLFEGSTNRAELEAWLSDEGFVVTARDDADADWTVLHLSADQKSRALSKAEARIEALSKSVASLESMLSGATATLKAANERAAGLEAAVAEAQTAVEAKAKALAERDATLKAANERAAGLEAAVAEAQTAVEAKAKALAERDATLKAANERVTTLDTTLAEQSHRARVAHDELRKAEGQIILITDLLLRGDRL